MSECLCRLHDCRDDCGCGCDKESSQLNTIEVGKVSECGWIEPGDHGGLPAPTCRRNAGHPGMHHADPDTDSGVPASMHGGRGVRREPSPLTDKCVACGSDVHQSEESCRWCGTRECPAARENDATQCICGMCYTTTLAEIQARNITAIQHEMENPIQWLPKGAK